MTDAPSISIDQFAAVWARMVKAAIVDLIGDNPAPLDMAQARYALLAGFLFHLCSGAQEPAMLAGVLRAVADEIDPPKET